MTLVNAALMALGTTGAEIYSGTGIPVRPGDSGRLYDMAGSREHYGEGWERLWVLAGFRARLPASQQFTISHDDSPFPPAWLRDLVQHASSQQRKQKPGPQHSK